MLSLLLAAVLGWSAGVLVNYLADVLPTWRKLVRPFCWHCGAAVNIWGYLLGNGRCKACGRLRHWRTWIIHLSSMVFSIWVWRLPPMHMPAWLALVVLAYFELVVVIDVEHRLILHPVSLAGVLLGLAAGSGLHGWPATLIGGAAGFGLMLGLYLLGSLMVRLLARWRELNPEEEALGFGDVLLGGVLGLFLGWPGVLAGVVLTIFLAGGASLAVLATKLAIHQYRADLSLPYGPFLVASGVILLFFRAHA